jgi:hypothetical protein
VSALSRKGSGMTDVLPDRAWGIVAVIVAIGSWIVLMKLFALLIQDEDDEESRMDTMGNVIDIRTARNRELARSQAHGIDVVIRSGMDRGFGGR